MATGPKLVHKQFNSPMGLYSQQNIQETLGKHLQNLGNGTVGIDFNQPGTEKPANLANSAVLRMLEEEERSRRGYPKLDETQVKAILDTLVHANHRFDPIWPPEHATNPARSWDGQLNSNCSTHSEFLKATKGQKKVVWPPVPETNGYQQPPQQHSPAHNNVQHNQTPQQQYQPQEILIPVQHYQTPNYQAPTQTYPPPTQTYPAPTQNYQAPQNYQPSQYYQGEAPQPAAKPSFCEGRRQEACGLSKLIPVGPGVSPVSSPYQSPVSPSNLRQPQSNRWAPVTSPVSPKAYGAQPTYPSQTFSPQPEYAPSYSPQPEQYQPPRSFEPPATTITLRQQAPVHQKPSPVFASQPAAATYQGGVNMRGDNKWPPQSVKEAVAAENEARRQLAKGPACRPRKVPKDYSSFFAQNALNHNYSGYRAPPGTQHYEDNTGRSSY